MIPMAPRGFSSALMALGVIAVGATWEGRSRAQQDQQESQPKVVPSSPNPPGSRPTLTLPKDHPVRKERRARALETLQFGPPPGVAEFIARVNKEKKHRIGFSKFIQRALA